MTPKEIIESCEEEALKFLLEEMINRGFNSQTLEIIKLNINVGTYEEFAIEIAKSLNIDFTNSSNDERLHNYILDLSKDNINQYNAIRNLLISSDLNFNWFMYTGSNLTTSRPFCLAMTQKKYFHKCEIPNIIKGDFKEFANQSDFLFDEFETISGMYSNTNEENFLYYRGGYGCGHQIGAIPDAVVPTDIKDKLYKTNEYKKWFQLNTNK